MDRFPEHLRTHFEAPHHVGEPPGGADLRGEARNQACGDHVVVFVKLETAPTAAGRAAPPSPVVAAAGFRAQGCPAAMAMASAACSVMAGLAVDDQLAAALARRFELRFGAPRPAHRHALALVCEAVRGAVGVGPGQGVR